MKILSVAQNYSSALPIPIGKTVFVVGSLLFSQWFLTDFVHFPGGGLGLLCGIGGIWFLSRPSKARFNAPATVEGWVQECKKVLNEFEDLQPEELSEGVKQERIDQLEKVIKRSGPQSIVFIGSRGSELPNKELVQSALTGSNSIKLTWAPPLPLRDKTWKWPDYLDEKDLLVYLLPLPLRAVDLLWLEKVPEQQPSWVLVDWNDSLCWPDQLKALQAQLPHRWTSNILRINEKDKELKYTLRPVRSVLEKPKQNIENTRQRLLSKLHTTWQIDLEHLRRMKFRSIQNRTQWLVAGAVFASPVPTTDLLCVTVVNGLMVQEMAEIWSCKFRPEVLQVVAKQLALAAVAQGVVEWSGQALLGFTKLHGTSWLAAGTLQSLSAAYLTRVVGRSMADWMALNKGVAEPDLEILKSQSAKLVAEAAEVERVDWSGFLKQASQWVNQQSLNPSLE